MFDSEGRELLTLGRMQSLKKRYAEAYRSFQAALEITPLDGAPVLHPQYLSHYAAALAATTDRFAEARRLCERSIQLEPYEPEHHLNLGLVHLMAGDRGAAFTAFNRGLAIRPDHPVLLDERHRLERRRFVPVPGLPRGHLINRCLGKLLSTSGRSRA
jgi:tetratricopeptide (TPR) repeat protein